MKTLFLRFYSLLFLERFESYEDVDPKTNEGGYRSYMHASMLKSTKFYELINMAIFIARENLKEFFGI